MRARSTVFAKVALVVVMSGVTSPATVTCVVVPATVSFGFTSARWPTCNVISPFHASMPGASTDI